MPEIETQLRRHCRQRSCHVLHLVCEACDKLREWWHGRADEMCWCVRTGREGSR
jgi:hypothetical protein